MANAFARLIDDLDARGDATALVIHDESISCREVVAAARGKQVALEPVIPAGSVVVVVDEFSLDSIALLLALAAHRCIAIPVSTLGEAQADQIIETSQASFVINRGQDVLATGHQGDAPLYSTLRERQAAGLVLFSSGSTGVPKGAVHDFDRLLENMPSKPLTGVLLAFLLFDHIGGINTLLRSLRGGAVLVMPAERSPDAVAASIAAHAVTILPTSPSFLAMMLASGAMTRHDLSSLKVITYGTEVMPAALLKRVAAALPLVALKQTYGLSEVGILSSQSEANDSTWLRLGGDGFRVRVVEGMLEVKSDSGMLGYLNAPSPYTEDGWFRTFDQVEVRGDLFRILGRQSEMINVGGLKVFPQEVESALLALSLVRDCVVFGREHPLTGQCVAAEIVIADDAGMDDAAARSHIRRNLRASLDPYKVPVYITIVAAGALVSARFKKTRTAR